MTNPTYASNLFGDDPDAELDIVPILPDASGHNSFHHRDFIDKMFSWVGATSVGIAITPLALRQLGIGLDHTRLDGACCEIIKNAATGTRFEFKDLNRNLDGSTETVYGIAGAVAGAFSHIPGGETLLKIEHDLMEKLEWLPFVGEGAAESLDINVQPQAPHPLARGGLMNVLVAGGLIIIGHYGGKALEQWQRQQAVQEAKERGVSEAELQEVEQRAGMMGRIINDGSKIAGFSVLLPAILPGVGHALLGLSATAKSTFGLETAYLDTIDYENAVGTGPMTQLAAILGKNPGACKRTGKLTDAVEASSGALLTQLCCALPAITASIPALLTAASHRGKELPESISPYRSKDHQPIPSLEQLAELDDKEIRQRIRDNQYHIADTKQSIEKTGGLRKTLSIGTSIAAAIGTAALGQKYLLSSQDEKVEALNQAMSDLSKAPQAHGEFHPLYNTDTGNHYVSVRFPAEYDEAIRHALSQQADLATNPQAIQHPANPVRIALQKATCAFNDQKNPLGALCAGFEGMCCNDQYFAKSALDNITQAARGLTGSDVPRNRTLLVGGASTAMGAIIYNVMEQFLSKPAEHKIRTLTEETMALKSILKGRQQGESFTSRLEKQEASPVLASSIAF